MGIPISATFPAMAMASDKSIDGFIIGADIGITDYLVTDNGFIPSVRYVDKAVGLQNISTKTPRQSL